MSTEKLIQDLYDLARDAELVLTEDALRTIDRAIYALTTQRQAEPVAYQYQNRNGVWCPFMDERHYENTVADGSWPIRALYAGPVPSAADEVTDAQRWKPIETAPRDGQRVLAYVRPSVAWLDALIEDVECLDCRYRGDPSYDHDAYYMRNQVVQMLTKRRDAIDAAMQKDTQ